MTLQPEVIKAELDKSLDILADQEDADFVRKVKSILLTNLDRGRIQKFIEGDINNIQAYVLRVADSYESHFQLVNELQNDKANEEWKELLEKMGRWAFNFLIRKGYRVEHATQDIAEECAVEAAIQILNAYFPFDVSFHSWARVIVQHTCLKYFRKKTKKSVVQDSKLVDIDAVQNFLTDPTHHEREYLDDIRSVLLEAISQLSDSRKQVIELTYFKGLSPKEAAEKMGKSIGAIYNLRFYALEDIRKILGENRNNINE
jgi:RNA polymerase sigma factor (sigma-70 family)